MTGYVQRHWHGEQSLARSFWLNYALLGAAVLCVDLYLFPSDGPIHVWLAWTWLSVPFLVVLAVWQLGGLWRSATRASAVERRRLAPWLAKALVAVNFLVIGASLAADVVISVDLVQVLRDPDMAEHSLIVDEVRRVAIFRGALSDRATGRLMTALDEGRFGTLRITSDGGLLGAAARLARRIREHGVTVVVEDHCFSACVFLLAASPAGTISPDADIVLHRTMPLASTLPAMPLTMDQTVNRELFREFGVRAAVYGPLRNSVFWQPTLRQMVRGRLIDFVIDPDSATPIPAAEWCAGHAAECDAARWIPGS